MQFVALIGGSGGTETNSGPLSNISPGKNGFHPQGRQ